MGGALLKTWLAHFSDTHFNIITRSPLKGEVKDHPKITHHTEITKQSTTADLLILAVKPQTLPEICTAIKPLLPPTTTIISIAAGRTLDWLVEHLPPNQPIIRAMPNMPVSLEKGATIGVANPHATQEQKHQTETLFNTTGLFDWLDQTDELHLHTVTALSGSGPAYLYYIAEALESAAIEIGLPPHLAKSLTRQTLIGAAATLDQTTTPASDLRTQVTSKNGTTAAALDTLMNGVLQTLLTKALTKATNRSKELAEE